MHKKRDLLYKIAEDLLREKELDITYININTINMFKKCTICIMGIASLNWKNYEYFKTVKGSKLVWKRRRV